MENPTSFDLNDAIQRWREGLGRSPHFRREDLAELEAHVRDSAAALEARGLTGEEAFWVATGRLGNPASLEPEFAKINRGEVWVNRGLWMLIGIQGWWLVGTLSRLGADVTIFGGWAGFEHGRAWDLSFLSVGLFSLINILAFAGIMLGCWWFVRHKGESILRAAEKASQRPLWVGVALMVLFIIYSLLQARWPLLMRYYSGETLGVIAASVSVAGVILSLLQSVGLVFLTVLLLRRRVRLDTEASC